MPRPSFRPTAEQRKLIRSLASMAFRQDQMCHLVSLRSPKTLRKHFRAELDYGFAEACAAVACTAYEMASSGRYPQMSIFWDKCQRQFVPEEREQQQQPAKPGARSGGSRLIMIDKDERSHAA
jgi:hypothetical protein